MSRDDTMAMKEINEVIRAYAQVLADGDISQAAAIWATDDAATFIHPRGHERGWEQVKRNFYEDTMFARFATRNLRVYDVAITVYGDTAWAEFSWEFQATFRSDGSPLTTLGRETQIFRNADRGWNLVHVHYSGMPVTGEREGF